MESKGGDEIQVSVFLLDTQGCVSSWNEGAKRLMGYESREVLGQHTSKFYLSDDAETEKCEYGLKRVVHDGIFEEQGWRVRKDGSRFWASVVITTLRSRDGNLTGFTEVIQDMTKRREVEDSLRAAQGGLERRVIERTLELESANDALTQSEQYQRFLADSGEILASSHSFPEVLQSISDLAVPMLADWCVIEMLEEDTELYAAAVSHHDSYSLRCLKRFYKEHTYDRNARQGSWDVIKSGKARLYREISDSLLGEIAKGPEHLSLLKRLQSKSMMISPFWANGKVIGAITFAFSDSDRRYSSFNLSIAQDLGRRTGNAIERSRLYQKLEAQTAELQCAVQVRDEFLSIASHELRTPLTPLKLQLQSILKCLEKGTLPNLAPEKVQRIVHISDKAINRLTHLVEDLLDVSRITAGKLKLNCEDVDLSEVIHEVVDRYFSEISLARCRVFIDARGPLLGHWDRLRLEQVVTNLLTNAIKFSPGKDIILSAAEVRGSVRFTVQDYGIGIDAADVDRVFRRFERVGSDQNVGGLGLGLYITRQIVSAHGGVIQVESKMGEGSSFTVELPFRVGVSEYTA